MPSAFTGLLKIGLVFIIFSFFSVSWGARKKTKTIQKPVGWVVLARSLTGESEAVRQKSLKRLRMISNLDEVLKEEIQKPALQDGKLNTQRFLALDVVTALEKRNLLPILISESLADQTGFVYHTINTLLDPNNADSILRLYYRRLLFYPSTPAVKLALLDTLGRVGFELSLEEIRYLNRNATDEVKNGLLSYMREMMILKNNIGYQILLPDFATADSFEVRMQTLFLYEELLSRKKLKFKDAGLQCEKDENQSIQKFCKKLMGSYS